jgi:hypothetical protein
VLAPESFRLRVEAVFGSVVDLCNIGLNRVVLVAGQVGMILLTLQSGPSELYAWCVS